MVGGAVIALAGILLLVPSAHGQACLGIPIEAGEHEAGVLFENTGDTWLGVQYAGATEMFAWGGEIGGLGRDFPAGDFPGDLQPFVGAGISWLGIRPACLTGRVRYSDDDPNSFTFDPGDSKNSSTS